MKERPIRKRVPIFKKFGRQSKPEYGDQETKLFLYLSSKNFPCMDCGNKFPPEAMDFDHRPGETKVSSISSLWRVCTLAQLIEEMAKCDLVCANCHRIRTKARHTNNKNQLD